LNITIIFSQTERGLVFNSRLWIFLSLLVSIKKKQHSKQYTGLKFVIYIEMPD